jgi:TRAP-type C4-dicarboxylate transport system permease small subunit
MTLIHRVAGAQLILAMLALGVMGCATAADVALKYFANRPIAGAYDLVETLLPVVVFHGLPATLLRRQTIVLDLIDPVVGPRGTRLLMTVADWVIVALLGLITWAMLGPALQAWDYGDRKLELGLPMAAIWAVAILGMAGAVLAALAVAIRRPVAALERAE